MSSYRSRLVRLLERGFYPTELPPPFCTHNYGKVITTFRPSTNYRGSTTFFDGATFRGSLRTFGVINPANFMLLSAFISTNWSKVDAIYKASSCSGARPKFSNTEVNGRAIQAASLAITRSSQAHLASVFPVIINLDITRFYGSIYTHSIPWAVLGKAEAKSMHHAGTLSHHWSDQLDELVRNCNQSQTVGIPIGPDTSRIVSEIVLSRLDREITRKGSGISANQVHHNIDDYQIGVFDTAEAENAQSCFVRALGKYELRLNDFKTSVDQGITFSPLYFARHFDVLNGQAGRDFVEHFFELLYEQIPLHANTNVLGYALKRFAKRLAKNSERELVREYLQRLMYAAPYQARCILSLLLGIYSNKNPNIEISRILYWCIEICIRRNDVGNLLWYLYAAIFLKIKIKKSLCEQCIAINNALVDTMLYHGRSLNLFSFSVLELRNRYRDSDFKSAAWLPLYEIYRHGWDRSRPFTKIGTPSDTDNLYQRLIENGVQFYRLSDEFFTVEAFDNWNLKAGDFFGQNVWNDDLKSSSFDFDWDNYD